MVGFCGKLDFIVDYGEIPVLYVISSMSQLNIEQLMSVYLEGNIKNGEKNFSDLCCEEQIQKAELDFVDYLREDFFRQKDAAYYVWSVDGVYRSALRMEPYRDGLLLEALETAPNSRRNGYAYALISAVVSFLKEKNTTVVYSHVDKCNVPSLKLHIKCGFQRIKESATYIDGTVTQNSCTMCYYL